MEIINPRVDIAFKKIFGVEENKDLLIALINSIVSEEDQVAEVVLLNPYNPKNFMDDKLSILDIKAKGVDGKRFNIEIQITDDADYDKRALYYWAKLYSEQLKASNNYSSLSKAIGIHILNFTAILGTAKYHNIFHINEKETGVRYFKDLELHTIELKKFVGDSRPELSEVLAKVHNSLDMWAAFLTRHDLMNKNRLPPPLDDLNLKKALEVLDVMNFAEDEREIYEGHLKWLRDEASALKKAKEDGKAEGRAEGRVEGRAEGREEGREEGRAEEAKRNKEELDHQMAKISDSLLAKGMSIEEISQIIGYKPKNPKN